MTADTTPLRIDAHHHVWDLTVRDQPWTHDLPQLRRSFGMAELRPQLASGRIDGTVVVQTITVPDETGELLLLAEEDPTVLGVVGWVDLTRRSVADELARLRQLHGGQRLVGIRHQVQDEPDPNWLLRNDVRAGLQAVAAADLACDLLVKPHQLDAAIATVGALPDLRFVLDHGGKPAIARGELHPWAAKILALAALPNVSVKLSGLVTEADHQSWTAADLLSYVDVLFDGFKPDRIMFGSDWPVCILAASYPEVLALAEGFAADFSESERAMIFGGSAQRWYRIGQR